MIQFQVSAAHGLNTLLCIGAHCDDIEIGCGGTVMALLKANPALRVHWVVMSSDPVREQEARASAADILGALSPHQLLIKNFRNGYFPTITAEIKDFFEQLKAATSPDLILTHYRGDFHQDHRVVGELSWNTFRNHMILEYEIPKYDGDLGRPNVFAPLPEGIREHKVNTILRHFKSQATKRWWTDSTFNALMRLRGVECNAPSGYAEAFYGSKLLLATDPGR